MLLRDSYVGLASVLGYLPMRWRYYAGVKPCAESNETHELSTLERDGVVVIENFLDAAAIKSLNLSLPPESAFETSVEGDKSSFRLRADEIPGLKRFFDDVRLRRIMKSRIGVDAVPHRQSVEWRRSRGQVLACDRMYHMDTWKLRLKAFLYLHDVTDRDGPMQYLRGSHLGFWRLPMEAKIARGYRTTKGGYAASPEIAYMGCYWPYEVNELKERYGMEEITCTGSAGTLVVFDARGLHRATELLSNGRRLLISYWIRDGHHT